MPTTSRGYAYPSGSDPTDVPGDIQALAEDVDADVTAVVAAAVAKSLFDANTILKADADNTPEPLPVGEGRLVGRLVGGEITDLTDAQVRTFLALATAAVVDTTQPTTSASFADLATVGPAVTLTTGTSALVLFAANGYHDTAGVNSYVGVAVSGATTVAASFVYAIWFVSQASPTKAQSSMFMHLFTGLTPGSNTFTLKYATDSGTANFRYRRLTVIPL